MMRAITLVAAAALAVTTPALAQTHDHGQAQAEQPAEHQHETPLPPRAPAPGRQHDATPAPAPGQHDHGEMHGADHQMMDHGQMQHGEHEPQIVIADYRRDQPVPGQGAFGAYPMARDASGTSWQPDTSLHGGLHAERGAWMLMGHVTLNGAYSWQDGPRGDEKAFLAGMIMGSARRDFSRSTLNLRAMLSPDPFMGARGYPLLFAAGESADGVEPLVDRQHPHDLIMEMSASYAHRLDANNSVFVYGGLPGEPAFGPPAFMHRMAAMDSPEAPLTHHWFDSTHITFGVVTAGWVHDNWKIEASQFRGREPDEERYDIETGDLDSTSVRLSWNPTENLSLQTSWAAIESPEALHPDDDEERWSVSGIYTRRLGDAGWWSSTLAFSNKERSDGVSLDAWLAEAAWHPNDRWTFFARGEAVETDELGAHHGPLENVQRLSLGAVRDFRINQNVVFGVGAVAQAHFAPDGLEASYDGDPAGALGFIRLKIG
ncbi:MAG: hypothetical protein M0D54_07680 [Hyphomonadaceae bacterium JAD_PAG50586_4]|nr:MAG: hypothetical protein M0D54_07680 [Hyphomonadaceae bacterium JAD_PAG50586_4]